MSTKKESNENDYTGWIICIAIHYCLVKVPDDYYKV